MMTNYAINIHLLLFFFLHIPGALLGQVSADSAPGTSSRYSATGENAPAYHLISSFFQIAGTYCRLSSEHHDNFMHMIGIEVGSNADQAVTRALEKAYRWRHGDDTPVVLSGETDESRTEIGRYRGPSLEGKQEEDYLSELQQHEVLQARALADIYFELERDLTILEVGTTGIEAFIKNKVAPGTGVQSDKPLAESPVCRVFDQQLASRRRMAVVKVGGP